MPSTKNEFNEPFVTIIKLFQILLFKEWDTPLKLPPQPKPVPLPIPG